MVSIDEIPDLQRQDGEQAGSACRILRRGTWKTEDHHDEGDYADAKHPAMAEQTD